MSHSTKKIVGQTLSLSLLSGTEKFYAEEGFVTRFVDVFVSQYRKVLQGSTSVLCFRKFLIANKFMNKNAECQDNPSKNFCLTVPKNAVGASFSHSLFSDIEEVWMREW